jgi:hypothetical protein
MDIEYRTFIIEKFVSLYNEFRFPILIGVSSKEAIENSFYSPEVKCSKIDNFCLGNKDDYALMSAIGSCDRYLIKYKNSYGIKSEPKVIIDEGRQKAGNEQKLQFTTDKIRKVFYEKSDEEILLQMADFMAFTINRIQNNLVKDRTKFDQKFMEMVGKLHYNNVDNLIYIQANKIHDYTKEKFDDDANKIKLVQDKDSKLAKEIQEYTNQLYKKVHNLEDKINRS